MNQKVNHISLDTEHNVALKNVKGRATIKLFDKGGHEVYSKTDDNLVTNAVSDLINSGSFYQMISATAAAQKYNIILNNTPLSKNMFGGLLLFKDAIPEDATKYMLPRNSICVGAAGNGLSSAVDRGSFNPTESEQTENGYKFVWDFTTSQCNGDISAIALTSILGGNSFMPNGITTNSETLSNFSSYSASEVHVRIWHNPTVTGILDSNMVESNIVQPFYISPIIGSSRYIVFADKMNMKIVAYRLRTSNVRRISDIHAYSWWLDSQPALQINLSALTPAIISGSKNFGITVDGDGFYIIYPTGERQFAKKHYTWQSVEIKSDFDLENPTKVILEDTAASVTVATTFDLYNPSSPSHKFFGGYDSESNNYYIYGADGKIHLVEGATGNEIGVAATSISSNITISACGSLYASGHKKPQTSSQSTTTYNFVFFTGQRLSDDATSTNVMYNTMTLNEAGTYVSYDYYAFRGILCACYVSDGVTGSGRIAKISLNNQEEDKAYYVTVYTPATYLATINNITPVTKTNATSMKVIYEIYNAPDDVQTEQETT